MGELEGKMYSTVPLKFIFYWKGGGGDFTLVLHRGRVQGGEQTKSLGILKNCVVVEEDQIYLFPAQSLCNELLIFQYYL